MGALVSSENLAFEIAATIFARQLKGLNSVNNHLSDTWITMDDLVENFGLFHSRDEIEEAITLLTEAGTLSKRNTGHSGYGNTYIDGPDVFGITERGIVELLFYGPPRRKE